MTFQKTNIPGYSKDKQTGLVINTQVDELKAFNNQKQAVLQRKLLEKRVIELEKDVQEQKLLMTKLLLELGMLQ